MKWIVGFCWIGSVASMAGDGEWARPEWLQVGLSVEEQFDSNLLLQSVTDQANRSSWVTRVQLRAGLEWKNQDLFDRLAFTYRPEAVYVEALESENHLVQQFGWAASGSPGEWTWKIGSETRWVTGNDESPRYTGPGGGPCIGGAEVRDRRDSVQQRLNLLVRHDFPGVFIRAQGAWLFYDFQSGHKNPLQPGNNGYQNYVDRWDLNGGLDVGFKPGGGWEPYLGVRVGRQHQATLFDSPIHYSNDYTRALAGLEGKVADRWTVDVQGGPDFRHYDGEVAPGFDRDPVKFWLKGTVSWRPTEEDTVQTAFSRFQWLSASGRLSYEDIHYDVAWIRRWSPEWQTTVGGHANQADAPAPSLLEDWIYSLRVRTQCRLSESWTLEAGYTYEQAETRLPNAAGREYVRHLASLRAAWTF
jgi:hypothetical protein